MFKVIDDAVWGTCIFEDTSTGEVSLQCLCGGIGMYWQRVLLTPEETAQARGGTLDVSRMVSGVCKDVGDLRQRKVPPVNPALLQLKT